MNSAVPVVAATPFDFAEDFSAAGSVAGDASLARDELIAEHEAAAYARGYDDGTRAESVTRASRAALALEACSERLRALDAELTAIRRQCLADAQALSFAFARKLAGGLIVADPLRPVMEAFAALLFDLRGQPEARVVVHPDILDEVEARLGAEVAANLGACRLSFAADVTLAPGDCRIDWPAGGLIRDQSALETRLDELVARALAVPFHKELPP